MGKNEEMMKLVIEKCDIIYEDCIISKEMLLQAYTSFLFQTFEKRTHNVGLVMHTGSICFDVIAITYAAIINLVLNVADTGEIIQALVKGDIVLYGDEKKERYIYDGKVDGKELGRDFVGKEYIKLLQENGKVSYAPEKRWRFIEPYQGESKRLDGRGIRKRNTNRDDFFVEVLGYEKECIPSVIDTSSVVVLPRDRADTLLKGITLKFGQKCIELLDLITASYYTDEDEYAYGGNIGKNEPILKFTSKLSVARKLLYSKRGNFHTGLLVLGKDVIGRSVTELPEIINRKSLQYVYLCAASDYEFGRELLEDNEDIEVFACTREFLLENNGVVPEEKNKLTRELMNQVDTIIDRQNETIVLDDSPLEWSDYKLFKESLLWLKRTEFTSSAKEEFIIQSHSLMNLFSTAVFSMNVLDRAKKQGAVEVKSPEEKLKCLGEYVNDFPEYMKERAFLILGILDNTYDKLVGKTGKQEWLSDCLTKNENKKIAIVVPKAYYGAIIRTGMVMSNRYLRNVTVTTPGRFDNTKEYSLIIVVGDIEGKGFNAFRCNSARRIVSLLYPFETKAYSYKRKSAQKYISYIQSRMTIKLEMAEEADTDMEAWDVEMYEVNKEIDNYISESGTFIDVDRYAAGHTGSGYNAYAEIVAIAVFTDETRAFFSKNYKGYIFDENLGTVKEEGPLSFCEGDSVVFTKNTEETKDIVDSILTHLIREGKLSESSIKAYNMSKIWKKELIDFMRKEDLSMQEVAYRMIKNGVSVQEPTICRWLDEDAHTVGPRNIDSIAQIGRLVWNSDMQENPEKYFEACAEIRSIRRRILEQIGQVIIDKLSGRTKNNSAEYAVIYEHIDSLAEIHEIERLIFTERVIPTNMANRPVQTQE